jgi:starch synthase
MNILFVTAEVSPYASTGGLGEVAAALPKALRREGHRVSILMPYYRRIAETMGPLSQPIEPLRFRLGTNQHTGLIKKHTTREGVRHLVLDMPELFDRDGIYNEAGADYDDNGLRFAALSKAAVALALQYDMGFDVIHSHDWPAALAPLFRKSTKDVDGKLGRIGTVHSIHNMAYQGFFPASTAPKLGINKPYRTESGVTVGDSVNFMKAGLRYADVVTTVSPSYAREITETDLGCGLEGVLQERPDSVVGILNGVDYGLWAPDRDPHLPFQFDAENQNGKRRNKAWLQTHFGLALRPRIPLVGVVSRLAHQKGIDILLEGLRLLLPKGELQAIILADGDDALAAECRALGESFPGRVAVSIGYDVEQAHRVFGGSDLFAMPSRYEPCGLSQLYAMRYGTIPVVRNTGGLRDTVRDFDPDSGAGTGFHFDEPTGEAFADALTFAVEQYHRARRWRQLMATAMAADFSWRSAAVEYTRVYERALEDKR